MADFEDVRKVLEKGWIKGKFESGKGCCLEGAIYRATGVWALEHENGHIDGVVFPMEEAHDVLARLIAVVGGVIAEQFPERQVGCTHPSIPMFNDRPETTFEDVLLVVDKAQRILEERV